MFIYNEESHALRILRNKKFDTIRQQKQEKYALIKYLLYINKTDEEINKILKSIKNNQLVYIDTEHHDKINYTMIDKAKSMEFIKDVSIDITKQQLDVIVGLQNPLLAKIMYVNLIYYQYIKNYTRDYFISKKYNGTIFVKENEKEILKLARVSQNCKNEIQEAYKKLLDNGYYIVQNFKGFNYYALPFFNKGSDIAFTIKNFDDVMKEILFYDNPEKYFRCEVCGKLIEKKAPNTNNKKYCSECARYVKIQKTLESQKKRR